MLACSKALTSANLVAKRPISVHCACCSSGSDSKPQTRNRSFHIILIIPTEPPWGCALRKSVADPCSWKGRQGGRFRGFVTISLRLQIAECSIYLYIDFGANVGIFDWKPWDYSHSLHDCYPCSTTTITVFATKTGESHGRVVLYSATVQSLLE